MARRLRRFGSRLAALVLLVVAPSARAAPVMVDYTLSISYGFESPWPADQTGSGMVDVTGGVLTVPAGFIVIDSIVQPVSASTAVSSPLVFEDIVNGTGTFRLGGVTTQAPAELCSGSGSALACNVGGGVGGTMPIFGSLSIPIIPTVVVVPVDFGAAGVGVGGSTNTPFGGGDAAAWTTGTARVRYAQTFSGATPVTSFFGTGGPGSLTLVTPTYISILDEYLTFHLTLSPVSLVPEPDGLLLLAAGALGLWALRAR
jgi:hypothetical protein